MAPELRDLLTRGSALSLAGKQDSAFAVYRRALARWPNEYRVHAGLGTILDLMGRFAEARQHWARAIAVASPQQAPGAHQQLAISYAFECRADDAARAEQAAIDAHLGTRDFTAAAAVYNEQARIYLECGEPERALAWYRNGYDTALRSTSLSDTAQSLWAFRWEHAQARVAARRGHADDAQRHVAAAKAILERELNPDQLPFFPYLTGYVAFYAGDYPAAVAELERASQTDPFVLALLARAHEKRGDDAAARTYWARARAIHGHGLTVAFSRMLATRP
jgi:tetratricopeptide (TPR) repeat protein